MTESEQVVAPKAFMPLKKQTACPNKFIVVPGGWLLSRDSTASLCTFPLGACLGIAIYDPVAKVGGLLHSLLPASSLDPKRAASRPGMFLDTGLTALLDGAQRLKATRKSLRVFVAGAAQIIDETALFNIGKINCDILPQLLRQLGVKLHAQNVGGRTNRSMELILATGEVLLKFSGQTASMLLCKPSKTT